MKNILVFLFAAAMAACQTDSYESGQGGYSLLTADFAEVHTCAPRVVDYALADGGDSLAFGSPAGVQWAETADTLYRAIVYYDRSGGATVSVRGIVEVPVLQPGDSAGLDSVYTDPVNLESVWLSAGGKYLNMGFYIKVGEGGPDGAQHTVGMVVDSVVASAAGVRTAYLRLYHDQGGVPEYYSSKAYVSVGCRSIGADSVVLRTETYDGTDIRQFRLSEQ